MAPKITISFLALVLSTLALVLAAAQDSNVLLTGDVLGTNRALLGQEATFIMQGDCNLCLYVYAPTGYGYNSGTHRRGVNCSVTLNDVGQLVITGSRGEIIWRSTNSSRNTRGRYAAVLRPDNVVAIYGPMVWAAVPSTRFSSAAPQYSSSSRSLSTTSVKNLMFSGEALRSQSQLVSGRDYRFVIQRECNLALFHGGTIVWSSNTRGRGANCSVRLGHDGRLVVADDRGLIVWSSNNRRTAGDYVLVLQTNGLAAIYGPIVWSTPTTNSVMLPGFSVV